MTIKNDIFFWGPYLLKTKILNEEIDKVFSFCRKDKKLDFRNSLAGHIKEEYELNKNDIFPILLPYLKLYITTRYERLRIPESEIEIYSAWVNYMKQGEFNPPHVHNCDLSCVLYLHIPEDMINNKENHVATSAVPGSIEFVYGESLKNNIKTQTFFPEKGDFFIFPAWLQHYVFPFNSNEERISVSANFNEITKT